MSDKEWFKKSFRRNLVDMHIEDWDESFLSQFDPENYVELLKAAQVKSAMVYANSHVGYCYWPTKTGYMHQGIKGRDILGEIIDLCHKSGIDVIIYYSLIYNNWAYAQQPSWRIVDANGKTSREREGKAGRYGVCCPNSGYKDFAIAQIEELCRRYDFEGIFFDMTFWPDVCYCEACEKRFANEVGGEMPTVIDWNDPKWLAFQQKREEWMTEFAHTVTAVVKKSKPEVTVEHQFSPSLLPWSYGITEDFAKASDYASGDFYGGFMQQSFICKMFYNITTNKPFLFHTSRCYPNLADHTTMKSKEMLEVHTYLTLAHGGAFMFIDAIDPAGTQNPKVYKTMGEIFSISKHYESYLGGELCQDVGVYFNLRSKMNFEDNGKKATDSSHKQPHLEAALGAARTLKENHIPYGVICKNNLNDISSHRVIVLPDVLMLDEGEAGMIRQYVANGGSLYASGHTAPRLLADVFGISYEGEFKESVSYIAPNDRGSDLMPEIDADYPLTIFGKQIKAKALAQGEVMATVTLPYTDPADGAKFASIHSNPPGITTDYASVIYRQYGKGKVIWVSAPLEAAEQKPHKKAFIQMIKALSTGSFTFDIEAPAVVEATMFYQPDNKRYIINLINEQDDLPPIPISDIKVRVKLDGKEFYKALLLPEETELPLELKGDYAQISVPTLGIFHMLELIYK